MKKRIFLLGLMAFSLLTPVSQARAEEDDKSWPVFDVAKLASLVTSLVARYQSVPEDVRRVTQLNEMIENIKAVNQATVAAELKAMTDQVKRGVAQENYRFGSGKTQIEEAAQGANGAKDAAKKIKEVLFYPKDAPADERKRVAEARKEYKRNLDSEAVARSLYATFGTTPNVENYFRKAAGAMENAGTFQDGVNANTMMIMVGNFIRINQMALALAGLRDYAFTQIKDMPPGGYFIPCPIKNMTAGKSVYNEQEKDEIDVDFGDVKECD